VAIFSTEDDSLVFFAKALEIKSPFDPAEEAPKLFTRALSAFGAILKSEGGMTLVASPSGSPYAWGKAWQQAEYAGSITKPDGSKASLRLLLTLLPKGVWALLAVADDETLLEDGGQLETVLSSLYSLD
ncbi:MAG: hypothetical protein WCL50_14460, partial [Spirochaetota bacterium]